FPNESPLGRRFRMDGPDAKPENDKMVIGVVRDAKYTGLKERRWPAAYLAYSQEPGYLWDFAVRFSGDAQFTVSAVRQAIHEVDPRLPVTDAGTLGEQVDRSVVDQRLTAQLSGFFSLVALFLACMGIYGLMSYAVVHRTNEIGIRAAFGAQPGQIVRLTLLIVHVYLKPIPRQDYGKTVRVIILFLSNIGKNGEHRHPRDCVSLRLHLSEACFWTELDTLLIAPLIILTRNKTMLLHL